MIKPDMIPDEVVEAAARAAWKLKDQRLWEILKATQPNWGDEAREALAAALNAWKPSWTETECDNAGGIISRHYVLDITPEEPSSD